MIRERKVKESIVEISKAISEGKSLEKALDLLSMDKVIQDEYVEFIDMNYGPYINLELNHKTIKSTPLNKVIDEADVIISFTQLK